MSLEFRKAKNWTATVLEEINYAKSPFHSTSHMFTSMFSNLDSFTSEWRIANDCRNSSRDHRAHRVREMWQLTVTPSQRFFSRKPHQDSRELFVKIHQGTQVVTWAGSRISYGMCMKESIVRGQGATAVQDINDRPEEGCKKTKHKRDS